LVDDRLRLLLGVSSATALKQGESDDVKRAMARKERLCHNKNILILV
jgi:hypothetical protein